MSLLEKATLITTPTAHSNGTLHSIKGGAVADFDVVRGSAATRVNAEGLIEDISVLSGELVTNGDFDTNSGWGLQGGATISDGKANIVGDGSSFTNIAQTGVFTSGKQYVVKIDVIINSGLGLKFQDGASNENIGFATTSGTYTFYFTATANSTFLIGRRTGGTAFDSSIENCSVVEVIDATNIPRIDYTTGEGVVLLEPQSTNLIVNSELNNVENIVVSAVSHTISFYGTGSITLSGAHTATLSGTGANERVSLTFTPSAGTLTCTDSGSVDMKQVEALPYATSYIPTSGAIASRLADKVTGAGDVNTFNSTEGVLYFEGSALADDGSTRRLAISDGTNNNRVMIGYSSSNRFQFVISDGGAVVLNQLISVSDITQFNKVAISYKLNDCAIWINGQKVGVDTSVTMPSGLSAFNFNQGSSSESFYGKVKALAVFNEALTDSELECLTKI